MVRRHSIVLAGGLSALVAAALSAKVGHWMGPPAPPQAARAAEPDGGGAPGDVVSAAGRVVLGPPSMLHLDPRHTNRSPFRGPTRVKVEWSFDTGGPVEAAPVVLADGTIVVASLGGTLFALGPAGDVRYRVDLGDRIYGSPLALDGAIFAGSDAHKFFGVSAAGVVRFRLDTDADVDTGAAPAPWGGIVFASGRVIYAVKPDGTMLWRMRARGKCFSSPAVGDDGTVYVGSQDHRVYAIAPDGQIRWSSDLGADVDSAPAVQDDGTVVVGTDRAEVVALAPANGEVRWRARAGGYVRGAVSLGRDGTVLVGTYGPAPRMLALTPDNGSVRFAFSVPGTGSAEFGIHGGAAEDSSGRLYFGAQDDHAYCLNPDGSLLWKFRTGGDVDAPLVIAPDGRLLVGSDDGRLYVLAAD